ncbi:hypothetical protein F5Y17DRAFT_184671 [Xylariaceae sp. FL0594]|nr:hypothetical protein F5Y17DRAFT_184671 [Xylariaceae sp. FL0594]
MPVEHVAELVLDIVGADRGGLHTRMRSRANFHATNASVATWDNLAPAVQEYIGDQIQELMGFTEWAARPEQTSQESTTRHQFQSCAQVARNLPRHGHRRFTRHSGSETNEPEKQCYDGMPDYFRRAVGAFVSAVRINGSSTQVEGESR